ncbi:MAG: hypothetical protein OEY58_09700 [Gammaproteobacteria bacterium]|nr:hypothetical protein [Gammaproteobacteria bacterium]
MCGIKDVLVVALILGSLLIVGCGSGDDSTAQSEEPVNQAPSVPLVYPVTSPTSVQTQTLAGEKSANSSIWVNGVERVPLDEQTNWSITDMALIEGNNSFDLSAKDSEGRESQTVTVRIVLDTTAPSSPAVNSGLLTANSAYNLTGTKEAGSAIWINGIERVALDELTEWSVSVQLQEGGNSFNVVAKDNLGNESDAIAVNVVLDSTPPASPVVVSPLLTNNRSYILSGTKEAGSSIWLNAVEIQALNDSTNWSTSLSLQEGNNALHLTARDNLGNESAVLGINVVLDSMPPATPAVNSPLTTENSAYVLSGTKEAGSSLWVNGVERVAVNNETGWSLNYTLTAGDNSFAITSKDSLGNESSVQNITVSLIVTPLGPKPPTVNPVSSPTNLTQVTLAGTKDTGTSLWINDILRVPANTSTDWSYVYVFTEGVNELNFTVRDEQGNSSSVVSLTIVLDTIDPWAPTINTVVSPFNSENYPLSGQKQVGTAIWMDGSVLVEADSAATWSTHITLSVEGNNRFSLTSVDGAGNTSTATVLNIVRDTIAPSAPTFSGVLLTSEPSYTLSGTKDADTSVWIGNSQVVANNAETTWSYTTNLAEGDNIFNIYCQDPAGNVSPSNAQTVVLNTNVPSTPTVTSNPETNNSAYLLTGTKDPGASIWFNGVEQVPADPNMVWQLAITLLDGDNIFDISSKDILGLESAPRRVTIVLDTVPPDNPVVTSREYVNTLKYTMSGNKGFRDSLWIDDVEWGAGSGTRWSTEVTLNLGINTFSLKTQDPAGNWSGTVIATIDVDMTPPGPVTDLRIDIDDRRLTLNWTNPTDDFTRIHVLSSTVGYANGPDDRVDQTLRADFRPVSELYNDLLNGTPYYYTIYAVDRYLNASPPATITASPGIPGSLDHEYNYPAGFVSFGTPPWTLSTWPRPKPTFTDTGHDMVMHNGKVLMVGSVTRDLAMYRFNLDGSVDTTFNNDGKVVYNSTESSFGKSEEAAYAVRIQPDGKILLAGLYSYFGREIGLWRFNENGSLDTSFSALSQPITPDLADFAYALALQSDGKIIVAGKSGLSADGIYNMTLWRFDSRGRWDITFGRYGVVSYTATPESVAHAMEIQSDGKIVVAGDSVLNGITAMTIWRFNSDGTPDNTFNGNGVVRNETGRLTQWSNNALTLQNDGKILVTGTTGSSPNTDMIVWRYNSLGSLDTTFNQVGYLTVDSTGTNEAGHSITVHGDGKIVVTGMVTDADLGANIGIWRLTDSGVDTTFNHTGVKLWNYDDRRNTRTNNYATGIMLDSTSGVDRIFVGGYSDPGFSFDSEDMALWRFYY